MKKDGKVAATASSIISTRATMGQEKDAIRVARASMVALAEVATARAVETKV